MFDVPQILTNGQGSPDRTSMTLIMFLNNHLKSRNYGMAGALSVFLFIVRIDIRIGLPDDQRQRLHRAETRKAP